MTISHHLWFHGSVGYTGIMWSQVQTLLKPLIFKASLRNY